LEIVISEADLEIRDNLKDMCYERLNCTEATYGVIYRNILQYTLRICIKEFSSYSELNNNLSTTR
jgi:hypothetical protein